MKYYSYGITTKLPKTMKDALERVFTEDYWGVGLFLDDKFGYLVELCKVTRDESGFYEWTHYAQISQVGENNWEISERHIPIDEAFCEKYGEEYRKYIGTSQTGMFIYGFYKTFGNALRNLRKFGASNKHRKPIEVYV